MPGYKKVQHCKTCRCGNYEVLNFISETGDSIYSFPFEEGSRGKTYIDTEKMREMVGTESDKRLGPNHDVEEEDI